MSYIFTQPPTPKGHVMYVKCWQPVDELTMQVCITTQTFNIALFM